MAGLPSPAVRVASCRRAWCVRVVRCQLQAAVHGRQGSCTAAGTGATWTAAGRVVRACGAFVVELVGGRAGPAELLQQSCSPTAGLPYGAEKARENTGIFESCTAFPQRINSFSTAPRTRQEARSEARRHFGGGRLAGRPFVAWRGFCHFAIMSSYGDMLELCRSAADRQRDSPARAAPRCSPPRSTYSVLHARSPG
jgi:hypothetical protein